VSAGEGGVVRFRVRVHAGARRTAVGGRSGSDDAPALVVRVTAPAVDGRANAAVIDALAGALGIRRRSVRLVTGSSARTKTVEVDGVSARAVEALMGR
jgi:uncharacterized protein